MGSHILNQWDAKFDGPIVDNKVVNRQTGELEAAGQEGYISGPPAIDVIWHNIRVGEGIFIGARKSYDKSVEEMFVEIAGHVRDGKYGIVSVSASAYSFVVVCKSGLTYAEFEEVMVGMFPDS